MSKFFNWLGKVPAALVLAFVLLAFLSVRALTATPPNPPAGAIGADYPLAWSPTVGQWIGLQVDANGVLQIGGTITATVAFPLPGTGNTAAGAGQSVGIQALNGSNMIPVKANANNALLVDGSAVTQPVSGTFWQATQPVSVAALPALTTGAAVIGAVTQSAGPWTENHTQINGSAVVTAATGVQQVGIVGNAGAAFDAGQNVAFPANVLNAGCNYNSSLPTITSGRLTALQCDSNGRLLLGGAANTAQNSAGNTVPATADTSASFAITTVVSTKIITKTAAKANHISAYNFTWSATNTVTLEYGTQTTNPCDTGTTVLVTWTGPQSFVEQMSVGVGAIFTTPVNVDVCVVTTQPNAGPQGFLAYSVY